MLTHFKNLLIGAACATALTAGCSGAVTLGENHGTDPPDGGGGKPDGSGDGATTDARNPIDGGGDALDNDAACLCKTGDICVGHRTVGGAFIIPDDAGTCPSGRHREAGGRCENDWKYACQPKPASCSGTVDCSCAQTFCADHGYGSVCSVRTETSSDIECVLQAP